ncbi:hypothetical protein D3C73_861410 [compost metagenome]
MHLVVNNKPPIPFIEQIHMAEGASLGTPVRQNLIGGHRYRADLPLHTTVFSYGFFIQPGPFQQFCPPLCNRGGIRSEDQCFALQAFQHRQTHKRFARPAGQDHYAASSAAADSPESADGFLLIVP